MSEDWRQAIEVADQIVEAIEELDDATRERGGDFFASVEERTRGIRDSITLRKTCTAKQLAALENMLDGVRRWQK